MYNRSIALPIAGLSFFIMSCQPGDTSAPATFSVTDSAGIEIVESSVPAWDGDAWTVSDSPSLVIGRREGDDRYLFGEVGGALMLRDGRIAVLDMQAALIRVYSAEGEHIEDWGGQGEGPGEFSFPFGIFPYRGDSILVSEFVASSFTVFDDQGRFGRRMMPEIQETFYTELRRRMEEGDRSVMPSESCCRLWGPLSTGAFLLSYPQMIPQAGTGTKRATVTAAINPDSDGVAENVGEFAGVTYQLGLQDRPQRFQLQPWFNMTPGPDGYFATEGDSYSVDEYDNDGRLRRLIRLAREPRPVTGEVQAAHEVGMRELIMAPGAPIEGGSPEEVLEMMLAGPYPSHLPTFSRLHMDPEGNLWAGHDSYGTDDDRNEYFVFSPDGRHLGMVELPAGLWVYQIGTDFVLGRVTGDLDVNYVHLYAIAK